MRAANEIVVPRQELPRATRVVPLAVRGETKRPLTRAIVPVGVPGGCPVNSKTPVVAIGIGGSTIKPAQRERIVKSTIVLALASTM
jgi:hypothetical protein